MPELKNKRHEAFCWAIVVECLDPHIAYSSVGYRVSSIDGARTCAQRLLGNVQIQQRMLELRELVGERVSAKVREQSQLFENKLSAKVDRLLTYAEDYANLLALQRARSEASDNDDIPGNKTGLLAIDFKVVADQKVKVGKYDAAIERDKLAIKKQYAIEVGDWTEKTDGTLKLTGLELIEKGTPEQQQVYLEQLRQKKAELLGNAHIQ